MATIGDRKVSAILAKIRDSQTPLISPIKSPQKKQSASKRSIVKARTKRASAELNDDLLSSKLASKKY